MGWNDINFPITAHPEVLLSPQQFTNADNFSIYKRMISVMIDLRLDQGGSHLSPDSGIDHE